MNAIGRLAREELSRRRKESRRAQLVAQCRKLMEGGNFRPTASEITPAVHDITNLFGTLPALHEQALDDITVAAIARLMRREPHRIARAAVFGRLST